MIRHTIYFTDGNVTKYVYSASGEKLRVIYLLGRICNPTALSISICNVQ